MMRTAILTGASLLAMWAGSAGAATVTINIADVVNDTNGPYVSVECTDGCQGIDYLGLLNDTTAEAVPGNPANESQIIADFTALTGIASNLVSVAYKNDCDCDEFTVGAGYFFIKKADWRAFFFTSTGTDVRTSDDISNYGEINVVPLPAAGWLLLAGVGGLVAMRRKKAA